MLYELDITPQSARNRLAAYQFTGEDVFKSVSVLSGGELSRLRLCMLMDESINLLILDEPTNHLDIDSREWLEQAVEDFDGTLLFVSHDRYFINRFATRVWELEDRAVTDYPMGFMQYRQVREEARRAVPPAAVPALSLIHICHIDTILSVTRGDASWGGSRCAGWGSCPGCSRPRGQQPGGSGWRSHDRSRGP